LKVVGINGSPRKGGNTEILIKKAFDILEEKGISTELINLGELKIEPCDACKYCRKNIGKCHIEDDFEVVFDKMLKADGIILGSPVYLGSVTAQMKALMDRAGYIARAMDKPFRRKVGGAIVVARRAGQNFTLMQLIQFFNIFGIIIAGSTHYWNIGFGREKKDVLKDGEAIETVKDFAENMAWILNIINKNKNTEEISAR